MATDHNEATNFNGVLGGGDQGWRQGPVVAMAIAGLAALTVGGVILSKKVRGDARNSRQDDGK